jgi:hypothetical protein
LRKFPSAVDATQRICSGSADDPAGADTRADTDRGLGCAPMALASERNMSPPAQATCALVAMFDRH